MHSTLGDHQEIMRRLGIVLDFSIPVPEELFSEIHVEPIWNEISLASDFNEDKPNTITRCIFDFINFCAQPKSGSKIKNRMLDLNGVNDHYNGR